MGFASESEQLLRGAFFLSAADFQWLLLLTSLVLVCVEFVRPGSIVPGIAGAVGLSVAGVRLLELGIEPAGGAVGGAALAAAVLSSVTHRWYVPSALCAVLSVGSARLLVAGSAAVSWPVAAMSAPVAALVCALLAVAGKARRNKRTFSEHSR